MVPNKIKDTFLCLSCKYLRKRGKWSVFRHICDSVSNGVEFSCYKVPQSHLAVYFQLSITKNVCVCVCGSFYQ